MDVRARALPAGRSPVARLLASPLPACKHMLPGPATLLSFLLSSLFFFPDFHDDGGPRAGTHPQAIRRHDICPRKFCAVLASTSMLRSEEHTSELQSLMRISYAVFCLKKKTKSQNTS